MQKLSVLFSVIGVSFFITAAASAAVFPDVPEGHMHQKAVENLVKSDVINGNPDGNYYPNRPVNRAELLKMLYKSAGKTPSASSAGCFPDVDAGSWYETFVCDAAASGYVNGYPEGDFKPGRNINQVEALKVILNILGINVDDSGDENTAWYSRFLATAYAKGVLPIPGLDVENFNPGQDLSRGEAASLIHKAIVAKINQDRGNSNSGGSSSDGTSSSVSSSNSSSSSARAPDVSQDVSFPFEKSGKFAKKRPYAYRFSLTGNTSAFVEVAAQHGEVTCRLYRIEDSGFANEFYLGHQEHNKCYLHTFLQPGNYQLQLQPTVADVSFDITSRIKTGDGNDGFSQARRLLQGTPKSGELAVSDLYDYYKIDVTKEQDMLLEVSNSTAVSCVIFPMGNVDIYGFQGPECNKAYLYPKGTYYVAIGRSISSMTAKKSYTLILR